MLGGLVLETLTSGWWLFAVGAAWAIGALWVENHALKQQLQPQLRIVYRHESPFERDKPAFNKDGEPSGVLRIFAVGVINSGPSSRDVSVKLMRIEPPEAKERWGLSLRVMDSDEKFESKATVHRSPNTPLVHFEVLTQALSDIPNGRSASYAALRFADETLFDRVRLPGRDK